MDHMQLCPGSTGQIERGLSGKEGVIRAVGGYKNLGQKDI